MFKILQKLYCITSTIVLFYINKVNRVAKKSGVLENLIVDNLVKKNLDFEKFSNNLERLRNLKKITFKVIKFQSHLKNMSKS